MIAMIEKCECYKCKNNIDGNCGADNIWIDIDGNCDAREDFEED